MKAGFLIKAMLLAAAFGCVCGADAGRETIDLSGEGWTFDGKPVSVPHTWNAEDASDGKGPPSSNSASARSYARRRGVYARRLPGRVDRRRYFVRCEGAAQKAVVRVDGHEIGRHVGSYTAFCFEATPWMSPKGSLLEIEVDNIVDRDVQPVQADFSVYGGLYRGVDLIVTDPVCIDCVTDGADGVRIEPNASTGEVVAYVSVDGGTNEVRRFNFPDRRLWSPEDPQLYEIEVSIDQAGSHDSVRKTFGFRLAEFRDDGFYLNGVKRQMRGVNYHQDCEGMGWAVPAERHAADIAMIKEMGADALRTAHYPHADQTYAACDRQGLLVWCEYPNVNDVGVTETYRRNALTGIREMIAQLRDHPSIVCWSVANEYRTNYVVRIDWLKRLVADFAAAAKALDPSRATAAATCRAFLSDVNMIPDVIGFNFYPGWYRNEADGMQDTIDAALAQTPRRTIAVTEYGAGGNIDCHASPEVRNRPLAPFHSEEYQAFVHHGNYLSLRDNPRVWGTFVWLMFDFGADARREGSRFGLNDKGLVTFDHKTAKDAFYFYKANWTERPFLHLVGKRMTSLTNGAATVMAFWNGKGPVALKVNGKIVGEATPDAVKTVFWKDVGLKDGENEIEVSAGGFTERAKWKLEKLNAEGPRMNPPPRPTPEDWVFLKELSRPEEDPAPDVSIDPATGGKRKFWLENRISRCFFGPIKRAPFYRDELMDDVDYYPDEYLKRLKREGVNGLWLTVEFRDLAETSFTKRDPNAERRYAKLRRTVEKCARYGIKIWIFAIEPRTGKGSELETAMPQAMGQVCYNGGRMCCSSTPEMRQYLEEALYDIFSHVPGLGGFINISHGERPTSCLSGVKFSPLCDAPPAKPCFRCSKLEPWQVHWNTASAMIRGIRRANPDAMMISWFYEPQPGTCQDQRMYEIAKHMPEGVVFQYNFESGSVKTQCGKERVGGDYWLSEPGPGVPFTRVAFAARAAGTRLSAKIQAICSHENACIPYVPVPGLLYRKFRSMHDLGVKDSMLCWYFGNYPGLMNRACGLLACSDFSESEDEFLVRLAKESGWGDEYGTVAAIWKSLSDAYANYPLTTFMQYYGPFHFGFVWPLYPKVELKPLSPTWKADYPPSGDTIGECLGPFTMDEAIELVDRMQIDGSPFPRLKGKFARSRERMLDLGVMETLRYQFMSARNIFHFYKARDNAVKASRRGDFTAARAATHTMREIVEAERKISEAMIPLCEADGRLGFHSEAESHQFYPARLKWRIGTLDITMRELDEIEAALSAGRPYPQSEMDSGAPTMKVAADGTIDLSEFAKGNKFVLVSTLDETGCRFPFAERVEVVPGRRYKLPDDAARIYIRPDYTSGAPLWPKCRYPRRHRLNLFGVEGRNFGRLVR